jgi:hypothetical protein
MNPPRTLLVTVTLFVLAALAAALVVGLSAAPAMAGGASAGGTTGGMGDSTMFRTDEVLKITAGLFAAFLGLGLVCSSFVPVRRR